MRNVRRATVALTVPLLAASVAAPPAVALAASRPPAGAPAAPVREPVGGPQLAGRGLVANPAAGVREAPRIKAESYLIADGETGDVLAAKDPHGHYLPASALKMLTAVSLIPKLDPKALVRPTQHTCDVEGTKVGMTPKMQYKVSDLFHALLMVSGNDAALGLTQARGGLKPTLDTMNNEARRLQAGDTLAGSPNGLDKDLGLNIKSQHTSAYDLALIMRQGLKLPALRDYTGKNNHWWPAPPSKKERKKGKKAGGYPIYSHIRLLPGQQYAYPGTIGGKNGYTIAAGQTFVGAAKRGGHTIIVSLMHGETLWPDVTKLLDWGFSADGKVKPVGTLVPPVDAEEPAKEHGTGVLPANPLTNDNSAGGWGLMVAALGGAVAVAIGLFFLLRRRRKPVTVTPIGGPRGTPMGGSTPTPSPGHELQGTPPPLQFSDPADPDSAEK